MNNICDGLGWLRRAVPADPTMEFGEFSDGIFVPMPDAEFSTGDNVYGVDLSHFYEDTSTGLSGSFRRRRRFEVAIRSWI